MVKVALKAPVKEELSLLSQVLNYLKRCREGSRESSMRLGQRECLQGYSGVYDTQYETLPDGTLPEKKAL